MAYDGENETGLLVGGQEHASVNVGQGINENAADLLEPLAIGELASEDNGKGSWLGGNVFSERVAYEDMTAIDWVFEYAKDRTRFKKLRTEGSWIAKLFDACQVWLVLIWTGIASGIIAAAIDVTADWLADLKLGWCRSTLYLNREFCCWGEDKTERCEFWLDWQSLSASSFWGYLIGYAIYLGLAVLFATLASYLVTRYAPYARQSGIAEVKTVLGGFVIHHFLDASVLLIKSLGLALAVGSGLWLGKEGPLVHVACCCANLFMKIFPKFSNEARKREILSAAAAAGISVAFGAPIGGVLFSLEQVSFYFPDKTMWQSFVCAMVAAVTLHAMNPFRTEKLVLFDVTYTRGWHAFEIAPYCLLGVIGGIYGGLFIKANRFVSEFRKQSAFLSARPQMQVAIVALASAFVNFPNLFTRFQSSEVLAELFAECDGNESMFGLCHRSGSAVVLLLLAAMVGAFFSTITFGLDIPAGIILPTMTVGALYGRALGIAMQALQHRFSSSLIFSACEPDVECVIPGVYAIIGAASALGGITRMTVSIVVIMFELTGALTYVLPIMIALMIAKWVGDVSLLQGIYESWIQFNGYPYIGREYQVPDIPVSKVMTRLDDISAITATGHTIESLENLLETEDFRGFPVISNRMEGTLLGYISRSELRFALQQGRLKRGLRSESECYFCSVEFPDLKDAIDMRPWMDGTPTTVSPRSRLFLAVDLLQKLGLRYVLFSSKGRLDGLLTKKDVWRLLKINAQSDQMIDVDLDTVT